jgi:Fe2+ transport system protein B
MSAINYQHCDKIRALSVLTDSRYSSPHIKKLPIKTLNRRKGFMYAVIEFNVYMQTYIYIYIYIYILAEIPGVARDSR